MNLTKIIALSCVMMYIILIIPTGSDGGDDVSTEDPLESGPARCASARAGEYSKIFGGMQNTGVMETYGPLQNKTLWKYETGDKVFSSPVVADGKVFMASFDHKLYALNAETGDRMWEFDTGDEIYSSPTYYDGKVYIGTGMEIGSDVRKLFAVDARTGTQVWSHQFEDNVYASAAVYGDAVYIGSADGNLHVLDTSGNGDGTTTEQWHFRTGGEIWSVPAFYQDSLFITSTNCKLFKINLTSHKEVWNFSAVYGFDGMYSSPTVDEHGVVYFGSAVPPYGYFYAVSGATGKELWNFSTGNSRYGVCTTAAVLEDRVYVGSNNGNMYALEAESGDPIWNFSTGDTYQGIYSSPTLAGGHVYFGSCDGYLYCLDAITGDKIWSYKTGGGEYGVVSTPAVRNGVVYFGSNDWTVYAIGSRAQGEIQIDISSEPTILAPKESAVLTVRTHNGTKHLEWVEVRMSAPLGSLTKFSGSGSRAAAPGPSSRTSVIIGYTDQTGVYRCSYIAPDTESFTTVRIAVEASGEGLKKNSSAITLMINPDKQLNMSLIPTKTSYYIGEPIKIEVDVTAGVKPADNALIGYSIGYDGKTINDYGITNPKGIYSIAYTAPMVTTVTELRINVTVTKSGYLSVNGTVTLIILPQSAFDLNIVIKFEKPILVTGKRTDVLITVTNATTGKPEPNADLLISAAQGTLDATTGTTDASGKFTLVYTAPSGITEKISVQVKVKASRINYNDRTIQQNITVVPEGAVDGTDEDGRGPQKFFGSIGFLISITIIIVAVLIAFLLIISAKKKRAKMDEESKKKDK